jgi:hypothetical protein
VNPYVRAALRFWWVLVLGVLVASLAAVAMQYRMDFSSLPPKLEARSQPTYATTARLLINSRDQPYLRTSLTRPIEADTAAARAAAEVEERPDIGILVRLANLYPLIIEGDDVAAIREEMFGPLPGGVSAQGIYSIATLQRFEPTILPVVEVFAASSTAKGAVDLAQGTVDAFRRYIRDQQDRNRLKPNERVVIEELQRPRTAVPSGGGSPALPLLGFMAVLLGFAALTILLDRLFPSDQVRAESLVERLDQRLRASDTA